MSDNLQPVEGAGLISAIIEKLFKGIGKALDDAAEYEEEMGVLKQINHIPIKDQRGYEYDLKITLAPVRDKDGLYYVEAETKAPGFNVASINGKVMKLDNTSIKDFKKMIIDLIEENKCEPQVDLTQDEVGPEENEDAPVEDQENSEELQEAAEEIKDDIEKEVRTRGIVGTNLKNNHLYIFNTEISHSNDTSNCIVRFLSMEDSDTGEDYPEFEASEQKVDLLDEDGNLVDSDEAISRFNEVVDEELSKYDCKRASTIFNSTNVVQATFSKDKEGVALHAIKASCDISAAQSILSDIVGAEDFVDGLTEDPQSFMITETEDEYNIEPVESVDVSSTYLDIFKDVSLLNSTIQTYTWALGESAFNTDPFLSSMKWDINSLTDNCAIWVINHTNKYPTVIGAFGNDCADLSDVMEDGKPSVDLIHDEVKQLFEGFAEILDLYYVNLEHEEQKIVDDFLNNLNRALAYA